MSSSSFAWWCTVRNAFSSDAPIFRKRPYLPKAPIRPSQLREIFQYSPANLVALPLQRALIEQASHPERQAAPLPAAPRAKPKFRPYGYVPSHSSTQRPIGRPYWLVAPPQRQNSLRCCEFRNAHSTHLRSSIGWLPVGLPVYWRPHRPVLRKDQKKKVGVSLAMDATVRAETLPKKKRGGGTLSIPGTWVQQLDPVVNQHVSSHCFTLLLLGSFSPSFFSTVVTSVSPSPLHARLSHSLELCSKFIPASIESRCPFLSRLSCWGLPTLC